MPLEVYIFKKGSYTVIIYSFAILGQSAKIPIKTCFTAQPLKMIPVTSKQAHPIIFWSIQIYNLSLVK